MTMTITVKKEMDFDDIRRECWGGAVDTIARISECDKIDDFMDLLIEIFDTPTMTDINDYLWFDADHIYASLGISEDDYDYAEDDEEGGEE